MSTNQNSELKRDMGKGMHTVTEFEYWRALTLLILSNVGYMILMLVLHTKATATRTTKRIFMTSPPFFACRISRYVVLIFLAVPVLVDAFANRLVMTLIPAIPSSLDIWWRIVVAPSPGAKIPKAGLPPSFWRIVIISATDSAVGRVARALAAVESKSPRLNVEKRS